VRGLQKFLWSVVPAVIVFVFIFLALRAGGPSEAVSAVAASGTSELRMYLRIDGIEGECTDDLHKGWLKVQTYEQEHIWGALHATEGGTDHGLRHVRLVVTRRKDKLTPVLQAHCGPQKPIPTVTLEVWREGGGVSQKVMVYTHHECAIDAVRNVKSLTTGGSAEELTFTCASAEWSWMECDASGKPKGETHTQCDGVAGK